MYFGKRSLKDYKHNYGLGVAVFFSALIGPFPAVFSLFYMVQAFSIPKIAVTLILLVLSVYSALTWRLRRSEAPKSNVTL